MDHVDKNKHKCVNVNVNPSGDSQEDTEDKSQERVDVNPDREFEAQPLRKFENCGWNTLMNYFIFTRGL